MCFLQTRCAPIIAAHHDLPATTNKNNPKSRSQNKIKRKLLHLTKLQLPHSCMHNHLCWTSTQDIGLHCQEQNELSTKHVMFSITESPPTPRSERGRKTAPASATRGGPTWSPWNHCSCCAMFSPPLPRCDNACLASRSEEMARSSQHVLEEASTIYSFDVINCKTVFKA